MLSSHNLLLAGDAQNGTSASISFYQFSCQKHH